MDVQMGYDQLRLTPGAWLDLLGGVWRWTGAKRSNLPPRALNPPRTKRSCSAEAGGKLYLMPSTLFDAKYREEEVRGVLKPFSNPSRPEIQ